MPRFEWFEGVRRGKRHRERDGAGEKARVCGKYGARGGGLRLNKRKWRLSDLSAKVGRVIGWMY